MIPLIGYADRLSLRPKETINFKVSCNGPDPYEARLVRIICGAPTPAVLALTKHDDTIRRSHGGQAVRNDNGCALLVAFKKIV